MTDIIVPDPEDFDPRITKEVAAVLSDADLARQYQLAQIRKLCREIGAVPSPTPDDPMRLVMPVREGMSQ
jgi:hypothetical protein